jgi:putative transcriptional regulator
MPDPEEAVSRTPEHGEARLTTGALLVARESLTDPNFSDTIVLLCQYGDDGAYGLVLNRPSHMPLGEIFEHPPEGFGGPETPRRVYIGGPVQPTELQILQVETEPAPQSLEVSEGVYLGGAWAELEEILARDPRELRLFLGYAGWGKGQLEEEIEAGAWDVVNPELCRFLRAEASWTGGRDALKRFLATF